MSKTLNQISPMAYAKFAGLLYLVIAISGGFSIGYVPSVVMAAGDAAATASNLMENQGLFRLGIAADIVVFLLEIVLTVILYKLLKPVNQTLSLIAAFARMSMAVVMGLNLLNYFIPLHLLSGSEYLNAFEPTQLQALAMVFLEAHQSAIHIWGLFFGLHLVVLGYLVIKSGYFPKLLGLLMLVGSFGYTLESLAAFSFPGIEAVSMLVTILLVIVVVGELGFTFWLLIKGIDVEKWNESNG